jgi:ElaB/YqjD/DUF883 family membrane-anchored ribosome-binding protein
MAQRTHSIQQDLKDIDQTRASMERKFEQLEQRIQGGVESARSTAFDFVDHVRNTVDDVVERAEEFVERTKQTLDPAYQVQRHPWAMIGVAIVAGYILGSLETRRSFKHPAQRRLPYYEGEENRMDRVSSSENIWTGIADQFQEELERVKGAFVEAGRSFVHDLFQQVLPTLLEPIEGRSRRATPPGSERHTHSGDRA